jgi:hypothetical protein
MNKRQAKRLLNVAKALRESEVPEAFNMSYFLRNPTDNEHNWCGTPSCALGHYAARTDLQKKFKVGVTKGMDGRSWAQMILANGSTYYGESSVCVEHFGITYDEYDDLFDINGCGGAKTPIDAARYIEQFVKEKTRAKR